MSPKKKEIIALLEKKSYNDLSKLALTERKIISILISVSYDKTDQISWRAMEAIGLATKEISRTDPETVRNIVGRLLWMIRDESGGIGWSAPDILGEIVRNNPQSCADIAPIIATFHEEHMLTSGVLRAMGRIGRINQETITYAAPIIRSYLQSTDSTLRGYAAWSLGEMGIKESVTELQLLKNDPDRISFYEEGELKETSVGELASGALEKISSG